MGDISLTQAGRVDDEYHIQCGESAQLYAPWPSLSTWRAPANLFTLMAGYTPVFSSVFDGTLHGKWPQTGVWLALLAMADRHGCIDRTPQAIASDIGIQVGELIVCIDEFMQPDPMSRTRDCEGRRLVLIDPDRPWGWRLVNHARYREKARLQAKDSERTASGADAQRKRDMRASPDVPRSSPRSPSPDSDSDSDKEKKKTPPRAARGTPQGGVLALHESLPTEEWTEWLTLRRKRRWPVDEVTLGKQLKVLREHDTEIQRQIINASINAGWQGLFPPKSAAPRRAHKAAPTTAELEAKEIARAGR